MNQGQPEQQQAADVSILTRALNRIMILDRAFQMEHNTGMVFDKDVERLDFSREREKRVLDNKFAARNVNELVASFKDLTKQEK